MTYDPEKYREKREKVLGIKKRGIGFGTLATLVSAVIVLGLSVVTVPQAVSYMSARHLDDAIYKLESSDHWPDTVFDNLQSMEGVTQVSADHHGGRMVVTFDRRKVNVSHINTRFGQENLVVTLLNQINHRQHQAAMKHEENESETP